MKPRRNFLPLLATIAAGLCQAAAAADESAEVAAIRTAAEAFAKDFNAAKTDAVVARFLPQGELIDEEGNVYQGREELQKLFSLYFAKYPGATLDLGVESIRPVSDSLAIQEGTRRLSSKDGGKAQVRYITVLAKADGQWRIASTRELSAEPVPTAAERLAPLAWLVGDWISEGSDLAVKISYRWDEDGNFLIGDFRSSRNGTPLLKSTQRIGWDPLAGKIRSWLFDADGGFAAGSWTLLDDAWVIKSEATLPDGLAGTATVTLLPKGKDQFTMRGTERIVGDSREDDFELTITRAPPEVKPQPARPAAAPGGAKAAAGAAKGASPLTPTTIPPPPTVRPAAPKR